MEIPDRLFETILLAVRDAAEEVENGNLTVTDIPEVYENACKKLACFSELSKDNQPEQILEAREKARTGEWFRSKELLKVIRHFYLVDSIEHKNSVTEKSILFVLWCFLGGQYSYTKETVPDLIRTGAQLYLSASKSGRYSYMCKLRGLEEDEKLLVQAVQILKRHSVQVFVQKGTTVINDEDEKKIQLELEQKIEAYGGLKFLQELFLTEIAPKYDAEIGRYMIYRGKTALGHVPKNLKSRIPYQYLIQLALKHLPAQKCVAGISKQSFQEIIEYGAAYLETLQLQGYSAAEDMFCEGQDLGIDVYKNMLFEKLYVPRQYHPEFIKMLLVGMFRQEYEKCRPELRSYSFSCYLKVASYILQRSNGPTIFSRKELRENCSVGEFRLNQLLGDISQKAEDVNKGFCAFVDRTTSWKKPLIQLDEENYFCLDARMVGYGFYEVLYQVLFEKMGNSLSREQGKLLEKLLYQMFQKKKIPYLAGKYLTEGDLSGRDCDMILDGKDKSMFLEIKKCPLPQSYETMDDVEVFKTLGKGLFYAQEQILAHRLRLKQKGMIELYDEQGRHLTDYKTNGKRVLSVSICMPEYDFFTERQMVERILEVGRTGTFHAYDENRESALNGLNGRLERIRKLMAQLNDEKQVEHRAFFDSLFFSLQQIWMILRFSDEIEDFLGICSTLACVTHGTGDVYAEIREAVRLKQMCHKMNGYQLIET